MSIYYSGKSHKKFSEAVFGTFSDEDKFEMDDNDMNGVVNEVVDKDKLGVFANRDQFNLAAIHL